MQKLFLMMLSAIAVSSLVSCAFVSGLEENRQNKQNVGSYQKNYSTTINPDGPGAEVTNTTAIEAEQAAKMIKPITQ